METDPRSIGRYEVIRVLGHGGMGTVYLAWDPLLKRNVAIKLIRKDTMDPTHGLPRFQREAEISARLNHPNVITVFDVGQAEDLGPFLAMEFVDGSNLASLIKSRHLSAEACLKLLIQAGRALVCAESKGITHRDIKPENMLVSLDGRLKLTDFGIARGEGSRLTTEGTVVGTPSYSAPEMLMGQEATPGSDRYALAVTAFELLTGELPFQADSVGATLLRIISDPPSLPRDMDPQLAQVFIKALEKRPEDRYISVVEFLRALIYAAPVSETTKVHLFASIEEDASLLPPLSATESAGPLEFASLPDTRRPDRLASPANGSLRLGERDQGATGVLGPQPPWPAAERAVPGAISSAKDLPTVLSPVRRVALAQRQNAARPFSGAFYRKRAVWLLVGGGLLAAGILLGLPRLVRRLSTRALTVETVPGGAEVSLDGIPLGKTPLKDMRLNSKATHLHVLKAGYEPLEVALQAKDRFLRFDLKPLVYQVSLHTRPAGAEALLDGEPVGTTPLTLSLEERRSPQLSFRLAGYQSWQGVISKESPPPDPVLLKQHTEKVLIRTSPEGASVSLDGVHMGMSPALLHVPAVGIHTLVAELDRHEPVTIKVGKGKLVPDPLVLPPLFFTMKVQSEPRGAEILLDDVPKGLAPLENLDVPRKGVHTLRLRLTGYFDLVQTLDPASPWPETQTLKLKRIGFWQRLFGIREKTEDAKKTP